MLRTYEATLKGDQLKWKGTKPHLTSKQNGVDVYVTILDKSIDETEKSAQGYKMSAALAELAALSERSVLDPVAWQKETRQDRPLPRE